jgi:HSP20 family protein
MADPKGSTTAQQRGQQTAGQQKGEAQQPTGQRHEGSLQRRTGTAERLAANPFHFAGRMADEMDRVFDRLFGDFGFRSRGLMPRSLAAGSPELSTALWAPRIEAFQEQDRFIVRAELPGLKKDEVEVNITDDAITLQGQRQQERKEQGEGFYHTERSYGSFYRSIPLPEGAIADSAEASFKDGVLEITLQAPPHEVNRGRKLEIK